MDRYALTSLLILGVAGCRGGQEPAAPAEPATPSEPAEAAAAEATGPVEPPSTPAEAPALREAPAEEEPSEPATLAVTPVPAIPTRDLATELREAVGSPADCVRDYRPRSEKTIRVRISAVVRPTGMIIEPSASGSGLSVNDRRCIEQRVGAVILEPLSGSSSKTVTTTVDIQYQPATVESYDVAPPPPPPDDVVQALPKKKPIAPSGVPIEGPAADPIEGPSGVPVDGPSGVPIEGPNPVPIESD